MSIVTLAAELAEADPQPANGMVFTIQSADGQLFEIEVRHQHGKQSIAIIEELKTKLDNIAAACHKLLDYRKRSGPINFQLEKADDYMRMIAAAIDRQSVV